MNIGAVAACLLVCAGTFGGGIYLSRHPVQKLNEEPTSKAETSVMESAVPTATTQVSAETTVLEIQNTVQTTAETTATESRTAPQTTAETTTTESQTTPQTTTETTTTEAQSSVQIPTETEAAELPFRAEMTTEGITSEFIQETTVVSETLTETVLTESTETETTQISETTTVPEIKHEPDMTDSVNMNPLQSLSYYASYLNLDAFDFKDGQFISDDFGTSACKYYLIASEEEFQEMSAIVPEECSGWDIDNMFTSQNDGKWNAEFFKTHFVFVFTFEAPANYSMPRFLTNMDVDSKKKWKSVWHPHNSSMGRRLRRKLPANQLLGDMAI